MNHKKTLLVAAMAGVGLGGLSPVAIAADNETDRPDTSKWVCERCPFSDGLSGDVSYGPGYVSGDNGDFNNFGGLEEEGLFIAIGADLWYRQPDGRYVLVYGDRLGLDSRLLSVEGGQQGRYRLSLDWKEIPWVWGTDLRTVYQGAGTADQTLPEGWVTGNTADMALLRPNLQTIDVGHQRETLRLGAAFATDSPWRYRVDFQHTERDGKFVKGASHLFTGTELVAPLNDETTLIEAAIGYVQRDWQLEAAYQVSLYEAGDVSVRWDNPFPVFNGNDRGELSLAPDNEFHQFVLSGFWRPGRSFNMAGQVAFGRATQDEAFLAPTLNANLQVPPLPAGSLDGEINTRIANFRINGHFTDRLRGRLVLRYDERDNSTDSYQIVGAVTDTFVSRPFFTRPYSYERRSAEGALDYRVSRELTVTASARRLEVDRDFQEVSEATTDTFSLAARANPIDRLTLRALLSSESRSNDLDPALLDPFENPSLRRYHFAEKDRDLVRIAADFAFTDRYSAGVFFEYADESYDDTMIGLSEATDRIFGFDVSASFNRHISASAYIAREYLDATILGADNIIGEPWRAETEDKFLTAGFSVDFRQLPGRWRQGSLRFNYAEADGEITIDQRGNPPPFPDLKTRRFLFEADVERELDERLDLVLGYAVARARADDFYRDGVDVDTMPNYIGLGKTSPDQTVHVFRMMLRYRFH